jgi:hypothetical protein
MGGLIALLARLRLRAGAPARGEEKLFELE